jgi:hypothetical protein
MPKTELTYYAGRLNLMPTEPNVAAKRELIGRALGASVSLESRGFEWGFLNVAELEARDRNFFTGYLVKFKPQTRVEIAQMETRTLQVALAEGLVEAKARFFLEVETGLILYHPSFPAIDRDGFETRFCQLFERGLGNFFISAEIDPIQEQFSIVEELQRFDVILELDVTLHPSNPDHSDLWADQDAKLKRRNVKWSRTKMRGAEENGGLRIKDDREIIASLHMAEDGYGTAALKGRRDGKNRRVTSRKAQISQQGPNDELDNSFVLNALLEAFDDALRRLL